jgi:hypothetical protein
MDEEKAIMESMIAKLADEKDELAAKVRGSCTVPVGHILTSVVFPRCRSTGRTWRWTK